MASDEKRHIFDNPQNVRRLLRALYVVCALLAILDFVVHRHVEHPWERLYAFYAIFGFVALVAVVLSAKQLRKLVKREEGYYDDAR